MLQKNSFEFRPFLAVFNRKQPKLTKNEENWQNPNRLMKFSEIWYVDASQQNKMLQKNFFWISAFFGRFLTKKQQPKLIEENLEYPNRFVKFSEIWYVDASQQKKMLQKDYFSISVFFGIFLAKNSQN